MAQFIAWTAFSIFTAAAMLFGYYWMANRQRDLLREVIGFSVALILGFLLASMASMVKHIDSATYLMSISTICTATLLAAAPRIFVQNLRKHQMTIGLLLRLSAYFAVLFACWRLSESAFSAEYLFGWLVTVAIGFHLFVGLKSAGPQRLNWLLVIPFAYANYLGFCFVVSEHFGWSWGQFFNPLASVGELLAIYCGMTLFYLLVQLVSPEQPSLAVDGNEAKVDTGR